MKNLYSQRIARFCEQIFAKNDLDAFLVTGAVNRFYLSGFELHDAQCNESSGCLLILRSGRAVLMTDPRYELEASGLWPREDISIYRANRQERIVDRACELGVKKLGIESAYVDTCFYLEMVEKLEVVPCRGKVESMRLIKDDEEILLMDRACSLNNYVFGVARDCMQIGMTEAALAWEIEKAYRNNGAQELSFSTIVGVNENAAKPHAVPGSTVLKDGCLVLVDKGCRLADYCSDQTRTFWFGENREERFEKVLDMVKTAQKKALQLYKPGVAVKDAYWEAMNYFKGEGVGDYFTHSLGHGIGLETHEAPHIGPQSNEVFKPGMVATCEPGLYYPDWGGVRWEHMVLITESGHRILGTNAFAGQGK